MTRKNARTGTAAVALAGMLALGACGGSGGGQTLPASAKQEIVQSCERTASAGGEVSAHMRSACECIADYVEQHATEADIRAIRADDQSAMRGLATRAGHACA